MESTVRRVVNLRLKGPSLFWCRASAEAILLLRSYYKAGRWNMLKHPATSHSALLGTWPESWDCAPPVLGCCGDALLRTAEPLALLDYDFRF